MHSVLKGNEIVKSKAESAIATGSVLFRTTGGDFPDLVREIQELVRSEFGKGSNTVLWPQTGGGYYAVSTGKLFEDLDPQQTSPDIYADYQNILVDFVASPYLADETFPSDKLRIWFSFCKLRIWEQNEGRFVALEKKVLSLRQRQYDEDAESFYLSLARKLMDALRCMPEPVEANRYFGRLKMPWRERTYGGRLHCTRMGPYVLGVGFVRSAVVGFLSLTLSSGSPIWRWGTETGYYALSIRDLASDEETARFVVEGRYFDASEPPILEQARAMVDLVNISAEEYKSFRNSLITFDSNPEASEFGKWLIEEFWKLICAFAADNYGPPSTESSEHEVNDESAEPPSAHPVSRLADAAHRMLEEEPEVSWKTLVARLGSQYPEETITVDKVKYALKIRYDIKSLRKWRAQHDRDS